MEGRASRQAVIRVRDLRVGDREDVVRIDTLHTGLKKLEYWDGVVGGSFVQLELDLEEQA